ncbi:MAG TPA: exodeoxyribonuclease VII small subunit [Bacteroidales bacterium]|nr:exodeoxyribonuclease VII small subunit [Bacteroidales bacterium]
MAEKNLTFNRAVEELEKILEQIESGEMDVDELTGKVKHASDLLRLCQSKLRETEEEIDKIIEEME